MQVKVLILTNHSKLVSQIDEVAPMEIGDPNCKLIEPFVLNDDGSIDSDTYNVEGYIDYGSEEEMRYEYQLNYRLPSGTNLEVDKDEYTKLQEAS